MTAIDLAGFEDKDIVGLIRHAQATLADRIATRKKADEALSRDAFLPETGAKPKRGKRAPKEATK